MMLPNDTIQTIQRDQLNIIVNHALALAEDCFDECETIGVEAVMIHVKQWPRHGRDVDSEVGFTKVLLDSGIYQGDLKRGVPHGEVRL